MTSEPNTLRAIGRLYVATVICAGALVVISAAMSEPARAIDAGWALLALLTLVSGSFTVQIPGATSRISVSETFVIIAAVAYGPGPAAILVALEGLIVSLWILKNSKESYRVFFNMATGAISVWLGAHAFFLLSPSQPRLDSPESVVAVIPALFVFAILYFLLNSWMIACAIGLHSRKSPAAVWQGAFPLLSLNYISGASLAALLLPYIETLGLVSISLVAPLMVLAYVTFRTAMGRIADANKHLLELNRLYLSTIETLAMAIDAKDQITHGHVRRVQAYAMGLAREIGVDDESDLKAIEAAALLHDMGKLAIPEHILNKPGKLTPAEFETMKRHADIGADILSSIDFPYPVVPIVRHHHENWNGRGYPTGLKGDEIPIGARILSVVDCFDALTSDRPYRPRLSDSEALKILRERAGSMYDPSLVDTFSRIYREIAPADAELTPSEAFTTQSIQAPPKDADRLRRETLDSISSSTAETRTLYELSRLLISRTSVEEVADTLGTHLRLRMPVSIVALFLYDKNRDELVAGGVFGEDADSLMGTRIRVGERISGWVAASRQTVLNSDPILDLGDIARTRTPRLVSCLSTALEGSQELIGVLTIYSSRKEIFDEEHRRFVELVANQASQVLQRLVPKALETAGETTDLQNATDTGPLERFFAEELVRSPESAFSILLVRDIGLRGDQKLVEIEAVVRRSLRARDEIFHLGKHELVVLMPRTDQRTCELVAEIVSRTLEQSPVTIGGASSPDHGTTVTSLLAAARQHLATRRTWSENDSRSDSAVH